MYLGVFVWADQLLARYLEGRSLEIVLEHSRLVACLALDVCTHVGLSGPDRIFIEEAALLHDIGVCRVNAPELGLHGAHPYIVHGVLGRAILEKEGYPLHALVCERHTGVGLTVSDILKQNLPLPPRDMCPVSLPEQIICYADLFYSKNPAKISQKKSPEQVRKKLLAFGEDKVRIFDDWSRSFSKLRQEP
ncbi:MAG: HD domain-containing protein [Deltaproteobacteria bacterium]|nr:HD domain-containing protein [Deltaproteobacteria bacterium]